MRWIQAEDDCRPQAGLVFRDVGRTSWEIWGRHTNRVHCKLIGLSS